MKGVVFDLDGTIIDSLYVWDILAEEYLRNNNIEYDLAIKEEIKDMNLQESSSYIVDKYRLDKSGEEVLMEIKQTLRRYYEEVFEPKEFVLDYIKNLANKGVVMTLASSLEYDLAIMVLDRLEIKKYFKFIITEDLINLSKRSSDFYKYIEDKMKIKAEDIYVFEDSLYSIRSAKKAGFKIVGVLDKYNEEEAKSIKEIADRTINSFREMEC